ncbi:hypothetical protein [Streptomyces lancefieldiae]|uniref:Uncharacterized protein n=1 Tax=Streptomyces lancefieldiae TaxID=3075520 RepID=A0ABU3AFW2_9ACTN|nr:hypothetical protein [Streptomyces sp. DSM 40712]MDT0609064.1 hypothetical protein [Streptomyces sp. DSM 40712]
MEKLKAEGWTADGSHEVWARMKFHKVGPHDAAPPKKYKSGDAGYKDNPGNTIAPASFADKRDKQAMRWVSTAVMEYLKLLGKNAIEIQAAVHEGTLYLSANSKDALGTLQSQANGKTGKAFLTEVTAKVREKDGFDDRSVDDRLARHTRKTDERLIGATGSEGNYSNVIDALGKPVMVVVDGGDGFHAERRIVGHLTKQAEGKAEKDAKTAGTPYTPGSIPQVVPDSLAGTKRPCVSCYLKLFQGKEGINPGPHWMSSAANQEMPGYDDKDIARFVKYLTDGISNTYATLVWECDDANHEITFTGKVTTEYGSDSNTDEEGDTLTVPPSEVPTVGEDAG